MRAYPPYHGTRESFDGTFDDRVVQHRLKKEITSVLGVHQIAMLDREPFPHEFEHLGFPINLHTQLGTPKILKIKIMIALKIKKANISLSELFEHTNEFRILGLKVFEFAKLKIEDVPHQTEDHGGLLKSLA